MARSVATNGRSVTSRQARPAPRKSRELPNSQYKVLLARLHSLGFGPGARRTVGLASSKRHEGVTTVACNLALYASSCHDLRVLLVDANHSAPSLHRIFQLPRAPGLRDLINDDAGALECIHDMSSRPLETWPTILKSKRGRGLFVPRSKREDIRAPRLSVMTVGNSDHGARSFRNVRNEDLLHEASASFDLVIVDLPAVNSATSCGFPLSFLDGVIFVLEAESTSDNAAQKSLRQLSKDGADVLGVAFNKYRSHLPKWIDKKLGD